MQKLISDLKKTYPELEFKSGKQFCWSPETNYIIYKKTPEYTDSDNWSLLHETGHALLKHKNYHGDFELLKLEVEAWSKAKEVANRFKIDISNDHIEDCLDTYREWLYKRSICPSCNNKSLQQGDFVHYRCFNCHTVWKVSSNRFCRAYRSTKKVVQPSLISA
ncbi:MAG TPA: hypothetical protein VL989_00335 [Candidatus Sulfotelmatobacter sp.]|nr:hypothetical protein [Candidatus Sulfotelmatobacter sp.]